jgi:hypothetical protein
MFDYPSVAAVAEYVCSRVVEEARGAARPRIEQELGRVEAMLATITADGGSRALVEGRIRSLNARLGSFLAGMGAGSAGREEGAGDTDLAVASDEEMFELIDGERGSST